MVEGKKSLVYACPWEINRSKSWSGTNMSLYKSLSNYYNLIDFDTGYYSKHGVNVSLQNYVDKAIQKVTGHYNLEVQRIKRMDKFAVGKFNNAVIFQFDECPNLSDCSHYIYLDLHVGYYRKMYEETPILFGQSGYSKIPIKLLYEREKTQIDFLKNCSGIFTMGHWIVNQLIKDYNISADKIYSVGGGYNVDSSKVDYTGKKGNKFLFVGRNFERKNGRLVVEAFKKAKNRLKDLELYIVGPNNIKIAYNGIYCLGNLSYKELIQYFNLCDVFCMPSLFEAYGLVFAEALTFGLPCIGSNMYEMPYFIEDGKTGCLLKTNSSDELCDLMIETITSEKMKNNVRENFNHYIKEYSWDSVANKIYSVLEKDKLWCNLS